jgi:hypothetical protein
MVIEVELVVVRQNPRAPAPVTYEVTSTVTSAPFWKAPEVAITGPHAGALL